jgi:hypothetical protein
MDVQHPETVVEVLPEGILPGHAAQVPVGGRDDPDVERGLLRVADPPDGPLLSTSGSARISRGSAIPSRKSFRVGDLEEADLVLFGRREGPLDITE